MKRGVFIILFILALLMPAACGEKIKPGEHKVDRPAVKGVGIEEITLTEVTDYYVASGTVRAKNTSLVSAKIMGEVKDIQVKAADRVGKGDVLLIIHSPDITAKVNSAQEALGEAIQDLKMAAENKKLMEKTYERYKSLFEEKAVTEQEFDEIRTKREVAVLKHELAQKTIKRAEAVRDEAEAFEGYTVIKSPVNGTVAEKNIDIGSMTVPGTPLFIIEESVYRVEVPVDEGLLSSVKIGDQVHILIDSLNMKTTGEVGEIVRRIDPLTRTFNVKIDLKEGDSLRGGFYAKVRFPVGKKVKLFVPESSIVARGELKGVYVVDRDGIVSMRLVKTGKQKDGSIEILSGLNSGERSIVSGTDKAVDGGVVNK